VNWQSTDSRASAILAGGEKLEEQISELDDKFYQYPDPLSALLYKYIKENKASFDAPSDF